jgi:dipeptidyl aminopeptidase/acylaminoacyl peptidase
MISMAFYLTALCLAVVALNIPRAPVVAYTVSPQPRLTDIFLLDFYRDFQINLQVEDLFPGELSWSPSGNAIVFSSIRNEPRRLYLYNFEDGLNRLPIDDDAFNPQWSPDGRKILYTHEPLRGNPALRIYDLENASDSEFTDLVFGFAAATWSPDGTKIAYAEIIQQDQPLQLQIQQLDDFNKSELRTIADDLEKVSALAWSPDGRTLACLCISRRLPLRGQHIILIDIETMKQKAVREADTRQYQPLLTWTSDGRYLHVYNVFGYGNYSSVRLSDGFIEHIAKINAVANPQFRPDALPSP